MNTKILFIVPLFFILTSCAHNFLADSYHKNSVDAPDKSIVERKSKTRKTRKIIKTPVIKSKKRLFLKKPYVSNNNFKDSLKRRMPFKAKLYKRRFNTKNSILPKVKRKMPYSHYKTGTVEQKEFYLAYKDFNNKYYSVAMMGFFNFIRKYPESEIRDKARFFIAECYYYQNEHFLAIDEYNVLLENFFTSSKRSESLFKIAVCYNKLNNKKLSDKYYKKLIKRYPDSKFAKKALSKN